MWYAVFLMDTGELLQTTEVLTYPLPPRSEVRELGASVPAGVWDASTRQFVRERFLTPRDFTQRLTSQERAAIHRVGGVYQDRYELLLLASHIDIDDPEVVAFIIALSRLGVIATNRVNQILA